MAELRSATPPEPLGIGERLRNAREAKGLSLRAVADLTRIRAIYLQALEDEQFDRLPGRVYARGFLHAYAEALGLDADRLMEAYPGALAPAGPASIGTAGVEIPIQPAVPRSRLRIVASYVAVVLAVALIAVGVIGHLQLRQFNEPVRPEAVAPEQEPGAPGPASPMPAQPAPGQPRESQMPIVAPEPPAAPAAEPPQPAVIDGLSLEVATRGTSWLRITADGERVFQGLLHEGDRRTWQARRRLTIRVGNSPVVDVTVNGRRITGPAGRRVWEQTFTTP